MTERVMRKKFQVQLYFGVGPLYFRARGGDQSSRPHCRTAPASSCVSTTTLNQIDLVSKQRARPVRVRLLPFRKGS
jgi:hypothetical protein